MKLKLILAIFASTLVLGITGLQVPVFAVQPEAGSAGMLKDSSLEIDRRIDLLRKFLEVYNSPLAVEAETLVVAADKNSLDWKLLAAIAGVESTFCKFIPANSNNCWGWGIPTGASYGLAFASLADAIDTISEGLKTRYLDRGAVTIEQIGYVYAASPRWAGNVRFFLEKIESFELRTIASMPITL